jgi:hypothetical protein
LSVVEADPEAASQRWWQNLNLLTLLVGAVVTTAVTLAGTFAYNKVTESEPVLEYELVPTPPLFGPLQDDRIFTLSLENTGEEQAKQVRVGLTTMSGRIVEFDVDKPAALSVSHQITANGLDFIATAPVLNPGDNIRLSLLVEYDAGQSERTLAVDVRGDGVTGTARTESDGGNKEFFALATLLPALAGVLAATVAMQRLTRRAVTSIRPRHLPISGPEPRAVILTALALEMGMFELGQEYMQRASPSRWWVEADYLTERALHQHGTERDGSIRSTLALLERLGDVEMTRASKAVVWFNQARLHHAMGDAAQRNAALDKARELDEAEVEARLGRYSELRL